MRQTDLNNVTGKTVKGWVEWLVREQSGCCSVHFASTEKYRYCVCVGWHKVDVDDGPGEPVKVGKSTLYTHKSHEEWRIYWKIGRQTHNNITQCDFDVDFEMPYVTEAMAKADPGLCEGDVDDTLEEIEVPGLDLLGKNAKGVKLLDAGRHPVGYCSWNKLATQMRKVARRVWRNWKDCDE